MTKNSQQLNPDTTICIVKHDGKEIGRIAATAPNASEYINELVRYYKTGVTLDYEENATEASLSRLFSTPR